MNTDSALILASFVAVAFWLGQWAYRRLRDRRIDRRIRALEEEAAALRAEIARLSDEKPR